MFEKVGKKKWNKKKRENECGITERNKIIMKIIIIIII